MIFIGIAILLLSFPLYYYLVKVKRVTEKSWKYFAFTATNIVGCIWISRETIEFLGGVNEGITWWDLAGIGIMLVLHLSTIVIAQIFFGCPIEENLTAK